MSLAKHSKYKDSGFHWLGKVPSHWELKRLGSFFDERREKASDKVFQPLSVTKAGVVPRLETAAKTQDGDNRKKVLAGDFVINSRSDRKGSSGLSPLNGSVSLICTVLSPKHIVGEFVHHLLRSPAFQEEFYRNGKGIVADLWSTNYSEMKNIVLPIPPLDEQEKIATFLDHETAKIDALIAEQKRLITLLKEKRQAIISRAVTKGLDPDVEMKYSGVEWIGEVPGHWRTRDLKYFAFFLGGSTPSKENIEFWNGDIPWVSPKDMKSRDIHGSMDHVSSNAVKVSSLTLLKSSHVLLVVRSGILRKQIPVAINRVPITLNQDMKALRLEGQLAIPEFIRYWVEGLNPELLLAWRKEGATVESIEHEYLANTKIPLPPIDEQQVIVDNLEFELEEMDRLVGLAKSQIDLLSERRSTLISSAVTGKVDVRHWQPPRQPEAREAAHG